MAQATLAPTYWLGSTPKQCDICQVPFDKVFFDVKTNFGGQWACACPACRDKHGPSQLGTGFGQQYEKQDDGRWLKTAG